MLQPADIRQGWPIIRPRIEEIIAKTGVSFLPEDLYTLCVSQQAALWMDQETGVFCILQKREEPFSKKAVLFIYAAWTPPTISIEDYWPQIVELAKSINAQTVKMHSSRRGWEKRPEWNEEYTCYKRRI